ncbi:MAG: HD domain-containing protein [Clostridium sp.]|nr:HD domain-containing protein [Clostridium sp.]
MGRYTVDVSIQELKPGMEISKDVIKNNAVLLKEGIIVTEETIDKLRNIFFLDKIQIYASDEAVHKNKKEAEIKKVKETFNEVSTELKDLFVKMELSKKNNIEDLRKFAEKIQIQFSSSELVLSTVIFEGSGDDCIYRHGVNVAALSALLGKWIGLEQSNINLLVYSALLHDFGITKLQERFQKRPDIFTDKIYHEVCQHTKIAYKYVDEIPYLDKSVTYGVLMHHERCDGSGYPFGIQSEKIHPFAKIIAIADELDALNSDKELKRTKGTLKVLQEIKEKSLNKLDYEYSMIFLRHICNFYIGEEVFLSNGENAKILQIDINDLENPLLLKEDEFIDLKKNKDIFVKELVIK